MQNFYTRGFLAVFALLLNYPTAQAQQLHTDTEAVHSQLFIAENEQRQLRLTNNAEEALVWRPNTDAFYLQFDRLNEEFGSVTSRIPNRFDFAYDGRDYFIQDGGQNMYDGGNVLGTNLVKNLPYADSLVVASDAFGEGSRYFTRHLPGLFVLAVDQPTITNFSINGNLGADGNGTGDVRVIDTTFQELPYRIFIKRIYAAGTPSVNHVIIVENPGSAFHSFSLVTETDYHEIKKLESATALHYLLFAGKEGSYIQDADIKEIVGAYMGLQQVSLLADWVVLEEGATYPDTLAPQETHTLNFTIAPGNLSAGTYSTQLALRTSDTENTTTQIPIFLTYNNVLLKQDFANQLVNEGFSESTLDLRPYFSTPAASTLQYTVSLSTDAVVQASTEAALLTIREEGVGTTEITVTATDQAGYTNSNRFSFRVNDVPDVVQIVADTTVSPVFEDYMLDLASVFYDSDGDILSYTAESSQNGVAEISLEGSILRIKNGSEGQTSITLQADDQVGGIATTSFLYTSDYTAGIETLHAAGIQAFPNPWSNQLTVRWNAANPVKQLRVFDLHGREMFSEQPTRMQLTSRISDQVTKPGMYLLSVATTKERYIVRLIKE